MQSFTLQQLNEYIRRVIALNFSSSVWIVAEISQIGESRGHRYLDLVQKKGGDSDDIIALLSAVLWKRQYTQLEKKHGKQMMELLQAGVEVKLQIRVDFHERYGLKAVIEDVDTNFTLGALEMLKQETKAYLSDHHLIGLNREKELPIVIQKIAVISSLKAAGLQDFMEQLKHNSLGYAFEIEQFFAAVQGVNAEKEIVSVFKHIKAGKTFDAVIIIRGGGSKLDLAAFDKKNVCVAIAECPFPVLTGIGHDIDESVADLVAHSPLKTPTAVADFLLQYNQSFESEIIQTVLQISNQSKSILNQKVADLNQIQSKVSQTIQLKTLTWKQALNTLQLQTKQSQSLYILNKEKALVQIEQALSIANPKRVLAKGFAILVQDGHWIKSKAQIDDQKDIEIVLKDGSIPLKK